MYYVTRIDTKQVELVYGVELENRSLRVWRALTEARGIFQKRRRLNWVETTAEKAEELSFEKIEQSFPDAFKPNLFVNWLDSVRESCVGNAVRRRG